MKRFIILMYHSIATPKNATEVRYMCPPQRLEQHVQRLLRAGYTFVGIDAVRRYYHDQQALPDKAVLLTLDDGFEDNYLNAWPIFQRYQIPAIIYLATGAMGKTNWALSVTPSRFTERKMLAWAQIKEMAGQGLDFGAHSVSHAKLNLLEDGLASQELVLSKQAIEDHLGSACQHFAYPYGLFNANTAELVKQAGFVSACSTQSGFNNPATDQFMLRRIEVYGNDSPWQLQQKVDFGINNASYLLPLQYYAKRLWSR